MTLKSMLAATATVAALMTSAAGAHAAVLYSNPYNATADDGDCSWSTTCGSDSLKGNDFAAQAFSLASAADLTSATFTELDFGDNAPTSINWAIDEANGYGGLPGTFVAGGSSVVSSTVDLGSDASGYYTVTEGLFGLPSVDLGAGSYYLVIQGVSDSFYNDLAMGESASGAAETEDGGHTFTSGYEGIPSVAISISGSPAVSAAPEPSLWALMIVGLGLAGSILRFGRRNGTAAIA